jgi:hypothetical protein
VIAGALNGTGGVILTSADDDSCVIYFTCCPICDFLDNCCPVGEVCCPVGEIDTCCAVSPDPPPCPCEGQVNSIPK